MFLDFFKRILSFPQKVLIFLFTDKDPRLKSINGLSLSDWQTLARPITHSDNTLSIFNYDNKIVRDGIFFIKNKKDVDTLTSMCQIIVDILLDELSERAMMDNFTDPVIVSIPSSKQHMLKRGYNPSDIIAKEISKLSFISYEKNMILKSKNTPEQKTLRRYERLKNVKNSMCINLKLEHKIKDRCVIVIDDIMTTGATLKEAKRVLLRNGARKVMGVVLAH